VDLLEDTGAKVLQTNHLLLIGEINVDMDTVLADLWLGHFITPET
jgi:hypothetical protein